MGYHSGELDQLITIKRETLTSDGIGGENVALSTITNGLNVWAKVKPQKGSESERFDKLNATQQYTFIIRYRNDLREDDHIFWGVKEFNVRSINDWGGRSHYLEIQAEYGVAQ